MTPHYCRTCTQACIVGVRVDWPGGPIYYTQDMRLADRGLPGPWHYLEWGLLTTSAAKWHLRHNPDTTLSQWVNKAFFASG